MTLNLSSLLPIAKSILNLPKPSNFSNQFLKSMIQQKKIKFNSLTLFCRSQFHARKQSKRLEQHQFKLQILKPEDLQECVSGLAKCFSQIEFVTHLNVTQEHLQPFMRNVGIVGLKRGLSIKTVDQETGKIAGCTLNIDIGDQHQFQTESLPVQFKPLIQCLSDVSHEYLEKEHAFETFGKWAHIWCMGVFKQYQGKKLTKKMLDYSIKLLKQKGYKYACTQLVSPLTQRTFIHNTKYFKAINKIEYNQYLYEGRKVMPRATQGVVFAQAQLSSINIA